MLRKVVLGSVGVATLIPVVGAATPIKDDPPNPQKPPLMKPSDLPIYETPHADYVEYVFIHFTDQYCKFPRFLKYNFK